MATEMIFQNDDGKLIIKKISISDELDIFGIEVNEFTPYPPPSQPPQNAIASFSDLLLHENKKSSEKENKYNIETDFENENKNKNKKDFEIVFEYLKFSDGKLFYQKFNIEEIKNIHTLFDFDPFLILEIIGNKPEIIQLSDEDVLLSYSITISNIQKIINILVPTKTYVEDVDIKMLELQRVIRLRDIKQIQLQNKIKTLESKIEKLECGKTLCEINVPYDNILIDNLYDAHIWLLNVEKQWKGLKIPVISIEYKKYAKKYTNLKIDNILENFLKGGVFRKLVFNLQWYSITNGLEIYKKNRKYMNPDTGRVSCTYADKKTNERFFSFIMEKTDRYVEYGTRKEVFSDIYTFIFNTNNNRFFSKSNNKKLFNLYKSTF